MFFQNLILCYPMFIILFIMTCCQIARKSMEKRWLLSVINKIPKGWLECQKSFEIIWTIEKKVGNQTNRIFTQSAYLVRLQRKNSYTFHSGNVIFFRNILGRKAEIWNQHATLFPFWWYQNIKIDFSRKISFIALSTYFQVAI